jgi:hypothetical protein
MNESYLERQEGPDGQWCDLLNRVPYDRQRMIETGLVNARSSRDQMDAALRGMFWRCSVRDALTGEITDDLNRAGAEVVQPWRMRAMELYNDWYRDAFPGPKGSSRTASPTPPTGSPAASETSA